MYKMRFDFIHKIVDDSEFMPDSELVRSAKFSPSGGDGSIPLYDYQDGKVPKDDHVSGLLLKIRSGKFDRSEIESIKNAIIESAKKDSLNAENKKLLDSIKNTFVADEKEGESSN